MKKLLPALALILLLICSAALGEGTLAAPFPGDSPEAILAARIGEVLNMTYTPETPDASMNSEARAAAANRMLADAGVILCDTPAALMAGLQGYTTDDLRTAMVPVCKVARIPLYLVMSRSAADEKGIADGEGLMRYLAENEYDDTLLFARHGIPGGAAAGTHGSLLAGGNPGSPGRRRCGCRGDHGSGTGGNGSGKHSGSLYAGG